MRFIHTADWHLGNRMYDIDRNEETDFFLKWLVSYVKEQKIETIIISGDVFDSINPSIEARTQYYNFLADLQNTNCNNIIIIGGNHDSGTLINAPKELFKIFNIHVIGTITNQTIKDFIFPLKNKKDEISCICIAIPFCREIELKNFFNEELENNKIFNYEFFYKKLYERCYDYAKTLIKDKNIPIITTGHLFASGLEGRFSKLKTNQNIDDGMRIIDVLGTLGNINSGIFPADLDYVALGHVHYTTRVDKNPKIRYSGSPFILGFDETNIQRFILDVNIDKSKTLNVNNIPVPSYFIFKRIEGNEKEIKESLFSLLNSEIQKKVFIEICYKKEPGHNITEELENITNNLPENMSIVHWKPIEFKEDINNDFVYYDVDEIQEISDEEIFTKLILSKTGYSKDSDEAKKLLNDFLPMFLQFSNEVNNENY